MFRAHEACDPETNDLSKLARMPMPRRGFAVTTIGSRIYVFSGVNDTGGAGTLSVVPVNEVYEP